MDGRGWIETLGMNAVTAAVGAFAGYLAGTSEIGQIKTTLTEMSYRVQSIEASSKDHKRFFDCAPRLMDKLAAGVKGPPPCTIDGGE